MAIFNYKYAALLCCILALSLTACHPASSAEKRRAEKHKQDSIALVEQEKSLEYYQSQLDRLAPTADSLLQFFSYEKVEQYQDHGYYGRKTQQSNQNTQRNYIQTLVRDDGQALVKCYYYGATSIDLQSVQLSVGDIDLKLVGTTHAFEAEGWHAILTLEDSAAMQVLQFIDAHPLERVRAKYIMSNGKAAAVFDIPQSDQQLMVQAYALAIVMRDICELERRIRRTSLEIEKYQKRLQKQ